MIKILSISVKASFSILLIYITTIFSAYGQLSGSYTINPGASASSTNYLTFASAVSDLSSGTRADGGAANGPGVSAAVKFTVSSGTYSEQVVIPTSVGNITGASASHTITFDGGNGNAANVILTTTGSTGNYATLVFNGCSYVVFENMTINNTNSSNGFGVIFFSSSPISRFPAYPPLPNIPCNNNKLQNCNINTVNSSSTSITSVFFGDSLTALDAVANAKCDTIDQCDIHGGYYSIYMSYDTSNVISNDSLLTNYKGGMHISTSAGFKIRNNYISSYSSSWSTNYIAIQIINGGTTSTSSDYAEISGNTIYHFTQIGIALQSAPGSSGYPTRIFNNFIGGGIPSGSTNIFGCIYATSSTGYIDFWNNSLVLNVSGGSANSGCIENLSTGGNWNIQDNIFSYTGSSTTNGQPIYSSSGTLSGSTMDYNIFYNPTNTSLESTLNGTAYTSSTIIGGGSFNSHSQVANPNFVSTTATSPNLDVTSQSPRGTYISSVTTDIHAISRANPPCIGADEIIPAIVASAGSAVSICSGSSTTIGGSPTGSGGISPYTYSWSPSTGLNNSTLANPSASPTSTTTYTVTVNDSHSDPVATATVTVTVNSVPSVSVVASPLSMCGSGTSTLTASGATTYTWVPSTGLSATTGSSVIATVTATAAYTVTATSSYGCSNDFTAVVTVHPLPTVSTSASPSSICYGASSTLTASGASTYTWSPSTGLSATTGSSVTANPTTSTTYTVTATSSYGCINTATVSVLVNPQVYANAGSDICLFANNTLGASPAASGGTSPYTYSWTSTPSGFTSTSENPEAVPTVATTYSVTVTDNAGCTATSSVSVNSINNAFTYSSSCVGQPIVLTASLSGGVYSWNIPCSFDFTPHDTLQTDTITPDSAGCFIVSLQASDGNCLSLPYYQLICVDSTCDSPEVFKMKIKNSLTTNNSISVNPTIITSNTGLTVTIPDKKTGTIDIYDILGKYVMRLNLEPGSNHLSLNSNNLSTGVYLYKVHLNDDSQLIGKLIWYN